jgi:hypothetical protein
MNRRSSIKSLVIATGGLISLPAWMTSCGLSDSSTHASTFSESQQQTLAAMVDAIIPPGNEGVGALKVGVDKYLQKLIDDCFDADAKANIKKQLAALEETSRKMHHKQFSDCDPSQRQALLLTMVNDPVKNVKDFYSTIRTETIRGFSTSQQVLQGYHGYQVAPGHYYGCVDLKA